MILSWIEYNNFVFYHQAGVTLLHAISYRGWITALENIKQLIESRPQKELLRVAINTAMKDGTTPLMLAADVKSERVVDLLISEGACPLDEDKVSEVQITRYYDGLSD